MIARPRWAFQVLQLSVANYSRHSRHVPRARNSKGARNSRGLGWMIMLTAMTTEVSWGAISHLSSGAAANLLKFLFRECLNTQNSLLVSPKIFYFHALRIRKQFSFRYALFSDKFLSKFSSIFNVNVNFCFHSCILSGVHFGYRYKAYLLIKAPYQIPLRRFESCF